MERKSKFRNRFDGWNSIQNSIATRCNAIEFRRAGSIKYDLFTKELNKEKGVDVTSRWTFLIFLQFMISRSSFQGIRIMFLLSNP